MSETQLHALAEESVAWYHGDDTKVWPEMFFHACMTNEVKDADRR